MFGRKSFRGGIHAPEHKHLTENKPIEIMPAPRRVVIPMAQHTGAPCQPVVAVGDQVTEGQKIGESAGYISACVHASISGIVTAIEARPHPVLPGPATAVVIENQNGPAVPISWENKYNWRDLSVEEIKEKIKEAGIVGLGGAAFPTHVKLSPPADKKIEALIVNGAECEPYLTTDHRLMLEKTDDIIEGIFIILKTLGIKRAVVGIEKNKADAIALFQKKLAEMEKPDGTTVTIKPLKVKYPQGAEKQLIKALLNREVPSGRLPFDVGVIVQNVGTARAVFEAVVKGKPLIERVLTVSGDVLPKPANLLVKIGTTFRDLVEFSGGFPGRAQAEPSATAPGSEPTAAPEQPESGKHPSTAPAATASVYKMIMGGPMMGLTQYNLDTPVVKGTSGFLVLKQTDRKIPMACVKCGACVDRCPMSLMPNRLGDFSERDDFDSCAAANVRDCMECGVCTYVCPSARPLVHLIKYAKLNLAKRKT
jgi:electron transport complex protein RnfC